MNHPLPHGRDRALRRAASTVVIALLGAWLLCACSAARAQRADSRCATPTRAAAVCPAAPAVALDPLERDYLACEHQARTRALDAGEAALCSIVYERLLRERFAGRFEALLAWWQQLDTAVADARSASNER